MKRFLSVAVLLLACLPVGVSIVGCGTDVSNFCDATDTKRISEVDVITLQPEFIPISLQYMQTRLVSTPSARNCLGSTVSVAKYSWASSNPQLVDISPSGNLCAGTWNRNTGGGIADYTICSSPTAQEINNLLASSGGSYAAFNVSITASANGISSNAIKVFAHPQVTSAIGYTVPGGSGTTGPAACTNPNGLTCTSSTTSSLSPTQCYSSSAATPITYCAVVCAGTADVTAATGQVTFAAGTAGVVNINTEGVAEPSFPGATLVTATVSGVTAAAGIYSTCAPASMALSLPSSTDSVISVPVGQKAQLQLSVLDSTNESVTLTGLIYTSTNPRTLAIISGDVQPIFGGSGDVYAACLQPACNPSPIDDIGLFATTTASATSAVSGGNGVPLISNPITVVSPGTETSIGYVANFDTVDYPNAKYIGVFNSQSNTIQATATNYRPNSMVLSQNYATLYAGSSEALMTFAAGNTLAEADNINVPGRVVSISPNGAILIISGCTEHDCTKGSPVIYLYSTSNGSYLSYSGTAYRASWSADSTTAYIAGGANEYVYSASTGWSVYPTTAGETDVEDVQVLAPPVGAFFAGDNTSARNYCAQTGTNDYHPLQPGTGLATERLGLSTDGFHLFGATSAGSFNDFCIGIPTTSGTTTTGACQAAPVAPIAACSPTFAIIATPVPSTVPIPAGSSVTGIPVATQSITNGTATTTAYTAFVTYSNCINTEAVDEQCTNPAAGGGVLPYYAINGTGAATSALLTLADPGSTVAPIEPTAGAVSTDGTTAYIATSGDNALHTLAINSTTGIPVENVATVPPIPLNLPAGIQGQNLYIPADKMLVRPNRAN